MKLNLSFYFFFIASLLLCAGCRKPSCKQPLLIETTKTNLKAKQTGLNLHTTQEDASSNLQKKLARALWNLDMQSIKDSLDSGADPYTLAHGAKMLASQEKLSPYALILEGYLARTNLEENVENIKTALKQLYSCIELLIKNHVSIDQGVLTFGSHATMRQFTKESLARLNAEKNSSGGLDDEGSYALSIWTQIQTLIDTYQPENIPYQK